MITYFDWKSIESKNVEKLCDHELICVWKIVWLWYKSIFKSCMTMNEHAFEKLYDHESTRVWKDEWPWINMRLKIDYLAVPIREEIQRSLSQVWSKKKFAVSKKIQNLDAEGVQRRRGRRWKGKTWTPNAFNDAGRDVGKAKFERRRRSTVPQTPWEMQNQIIKIEIHYER